MQYLNVIEFSKNFDRFHVRYIKLKIFKIILFFSLDIVLQFIFKVRILSRTVSTIMNVKNTK